MNHEEIIKNFTMTGLLNDLQEYSKRVKNIVNEIERRELLDK